MITLTIINTLLIAYLYFNKLHISLIIDKQRTFYKETLTGIVVELWKVVRADSYEVSSKCIFAITIPIKNHAKTELAEEIEWMIPNLGKRQRLGAKFSWLKTDKEVEQFKKDYYVVDPEFVQQLVGGYYAKKISENN